MTRLFFLPSESWQETFTPIVQEQATQALEEGAVVYFANLPFYLQGDEAPLLSPSILQGAKNISFDSADGTVRGITGNAAVQTRAGALLARFAAASRDLLLRICPHYAAGVNTGRTSFRPVEIAGRPTSWRKDDTRLHVDSFPSMPMRGKRILRVFSNINHEGKPRVWRIGGDFDSVAKRFWPDLRPPGWGLTTLLHILRVTKTRRSAYDSYMLQLHDAMKSDLAYQTRGEQITHPFPPGSTWIAFTDQVPHAAMSGAHLLEQTMYVPVTCLHNERKAPLRILERLAGKALV